MNSPTATVSRLLPFSCVDGPGNRLVLFLQGCNFACVTCHNPHTRGHCNGCGDCIPACTTGALTLEDGAIVFDAARCTGCDDCLAACPISANPMVREMTVGDVLYILRDRRAFLDGITLSGGEATVQAKFVAALFRAIKEDPSLSGLSCMIDSNGYLAGTGWARLLPWTDGVMLDIKAMDPDTHRRLTGKDNARVLESARLLYRAGRLAELRFLVVPGITDAEREVAALAEFVRALDTRLRLRLNAFRTHGVTGPAASWPTSDRATIERVADRLSQAGLCNIATAVVF
ncbi:YjjW family glycine radical enzyme activase [Tropicimonas sp. IMCC6043]|uniref:YjjW family glycine radical enzyme activase n=1 Tax=Tropicimonas sp. IMCC6043 TaxID=2510645 RepID=UPI00101B91D3|nr:YjjW family glycine radical enzyme activase [Tropicimonas sp. IMCC6043]RYH10916.1 YjjW family glycine radical enzyme activase [Tropicimonas sp. IMCC6043]